MLDLTNLPLMRANKHTHTTLEADRMGLGSVLVAPTVTAVRGQAETVTQLI